MEDDDADMVIAYVPLAGSFSVSVRALQAFGSFDQGGTVTDACVAEAFAYRNFLPPSFLPYMYKTGKRTFSDPFSIIGEALPLRQVREVGFDIPRWEFVQARDATGTYLPQVWRGKHVAQYRQLATPGGGTSFSHFPPS